LREKGRRERERTHKKREKGKDKKTNFFFKRLEGHRAGKKKKKFKVPYMLCQEVARKRKKKLKKS
jgi:hypothetical protein